MKPRPVMAVLLAAGTAALLAACAARAPRPAAAALPRLHLAPASLGHVLAQQQQLVFDYGGGQQRTLDALLEVDAGQVRLDLQALGRSALRLVWDGQKLEQRRADWLPPTVRGEDVLDELQLAQWPLGAIRAALPPGWSVDEHDGVRRLWHGQERVASVSYPAPDRIVIQRPRFTLRIRTVTLAEPTP